METFVYRPKGVCSQQMTFTMDGDIIRDVKIVGGCAGNLLGISRILKDKKISEVMEAFHGVRCGMRRPHVQIRLRRLCRHMQSSTIWIFNKKPLTMTGT